MRKTHTQHLLSTYKYVRENGESREFRIHSILVSMLPNQQYPDILLIVLILPIVPYESEVADIIFLLNSRGER